MKKFVAIYLGSAEGLAEWKATNDEKKKEREKAGMEGWMKWAKDNEASIIDLGSPLGKTKRIDPRGISDTKNEITAYTIVQAESHDAAAELFANHPHFMIFPGQSVEVMECLPIPKIYTENLRHPRVAGGVARALVLGWGVGLSNAPRISEKAWGLRAIDCTG